MEESEVRGDLLVEDAQSVRHVDLSEPGDLVAVAQSVSRGGLLAPAVEGQDHGVVERRGMKGGRSVPQVMSDVVPPVRTVRASTRKRPRR